MPLLWNFKAIKGRQLLWTAMLSWTFCILTLLGNQVVGETTTVLTITPTVSKTGTTSSPTKEAVKEVTQNSSITANSTATSPVSPKSSHVDKEKENDTTNATGSPTTVSKLISTTVNQTAQPSLAHENTSHAVNNETNTIITPKTFPTSTSTEKPMLSDSSTPTKAGSSSVTSNWTCMDIMEVTSDKVICLEMNEPYSCDKFVKEKGASFAAVVCVKPISCKIKLTVSSVNHKCILLVGHGDKDTQELDAVLQENKSALEKQAITPHRQEVIGNHYQKPSRTTLIALVTSGLLLAFLGLTAYFLMKRRSWSPMGERLGEDPYYTENGSHGNTVASHEQSDLQDKPNLNGGSRENGTGQPASKNGHSTRPHVVADTEL